MTQPTGSAVRSLGIIYHEFPVTGQPAPHLIYGNRTMRALILVLLLCILTSCSVFETDEKAGDVLVLSIAPHLVITNKTEARIYYFVVGRETAARINWALHTNLDQSIAKNSTVKISHQDIYRSETEKEVIVYWWHAVNAIGSIKPGESHAIVAKL